MAAVVDEVWGTSFSSSPWRGATCNSDALLWSAWYLFWPSKFLTSLPFLRFRCCCRHHQHHITYMTPEIVAFQMWAPRRIRVILLTPWVPDFGDLLHPPQQMEYQAAKNDSKTHQLAVKPGFSTSLCGASGKMYKESILHSSRKLFVKNLSWGYN